MGSLIIKDPIVTDRKKALFFTLDDLSLAYSCSVPTIWALQFSRRRMLNIVSGSCNANNQTIHTTNKQSYKEVLPANTAYVQEYTLQESVHCDLICNFLSKELKGLERPMGNLEKIINLGQGLSPGLSFRIIYQAI